ATIGGNRNSERDVVRVPTVPARVELLRVLYASWFALALAAPFEVQNPLAEGWIERLVITRCSTQRFVRIVANAKAEFGAHGNHHSIFPQLLASHDLLRRQ